MLLDSGAAALLAVHSALALALARRSPAHARVGLFGAAAALGFAMLAGARSLDLEVEAPRTALAAVWAMGAWALARTCLAGRTAAPVLAIAALTVVLSAVLGGGWVRSGVWIGGLAGAWWSVAKALRSAPSSEPGVAHLGVLLHVAAGTVAATIDDPAIPVLAATGVAVVAQGASLARHREVRRDGDPDEQLRDSVRVRDLAHVAGVVPSGAASGEPP